MEQAEAQEQKQPSEEEGYSPGMSRVCPNPFGRTVPGNDQGHQHEVNNFTLPEAAGHISTNYCRKKQSFYQTALREQQSPMQNQGQTLASH